MLSKRFFVSFNVEEQCFPHWLTRMCASASSGTLHQPWYGCVLMSASWYVETSGGWHGQWNIRSNRIGVFSIFPKSSRDFVKELMIYFSKSRMCLFVIQNIEHRIPKTAFAHFAIVRAQWMILLNAIIIFLNGWVGKNFFFETWYSNQPVHNLDKDIKKPNRSKWLGFWISTKQPSSGFWNHFFGRCWGHQRRLFLKVWRVASASKVVYEKEVWKPVAVTEDDESWSIWRKTRWKERSSLKSQKKSVKFWTWGHNLRVSDGQAHMFLKKRGGNFQEIPVRKRIQVIGMCNESSKKKTCDAVEQRIQSANMTFWKDTMIFKSKNVRGGQNVSGWKRHVCRILLWKWILTMDAADTEKFEKNNEEIIQTEKTKKMRRVFGTKTEHVIWQGKYGCKKICSCCLQRSWKTWNVSWCGPAMKIRKLWLILWEKWTSGNPHTQE